MGFSFITGQQTIMHADNASFDGTERSGALSSNGQLWIGSVNSPHVVKSTLTAGSGISITNGPGSITIANSGALTDLHTARYIVSAGGSTDGANYTTIASAITAASGAGGVQTVFIQPGTYTENLTMAANVNLAAYDCDAGTPNVTINGKVTASYSGSASISGIRLQTNSDFCVVQSGSNACNLRLIECYISALNNTAISITNSNSASNFFITRCSGDISTTGIAYFSKSGIGKFKIFHSTLLNNGGSSTASSVSGAGLDIIHTYFQNDITNSGAQAIITDSAVNSLTTSSTATFTINNSACSILTTAGTGSTTASLSSFSGDTSSAVSVGAGTTVTLGNCTVNSSNTNAITGAGTISYGGVTFTGSSSTVNTTTQTGLPLTVRQGGTGLNATTTSQILYSSGTNTIAGLATANSGVLVTNGSGVPSIGSKILGVNGGGLILISSQTASNVATISFTSLNVYSTYFITITQAQPVTDAKQLELLVSNDNGSTYISTGYTNGINYSSYNSTTLTNFNSTTYIPITNTMANTGLCVAHFYLYNLNIGTYFSIQGNSTWDDSGAATTVTGAFLGRSGSTGVNAIQFKYAAGNINTGTFSLYGLQQS